MVPFDKGDLRNFKEVIKLAEEKEMKWEAGKNTHENIIYVCFGGLSNTGITAAKASMEAVKELGLKKTIC